jgi:hypothetical protein
MNWLNRFLLANWSWLIDGMLLLMALIIGIQVGESHVHKEWNAEKSKNEQLAAKLEQHVADVKLMQNQINQEISNDFSKKSNLLASYLSSVSFDRMYNTATIYGGNLSSISTDTAETSKVTSDVLPAPSSDEVKLSCGKLTEDAAQTTLMLVEIQHWLESQSQANK